MTRVYDWTAIRAAMKPTTSPVVRRETFVDNLFGGELDVTIHEDGSITVVAERQPAPGFDEGRG